LFGYDRLYVLSDEDKPIWGWVERRDDSPEQLAATVSQWSDLVGAIRKPGTAQTQYQVVTTPISLGNGQTLEHRAVADVRNIGGNPAMVVVSTIVPDHVTPRPFMTPTFLLVAVEYLDADFTRRLGADFEFRDLHWITDDPPKNFSTFDVKSLEGSSVGTLAWRRDQPGWDFIKDIALGLVLALCLVGALAAILVRWGSQQASKILESEAEAVHAANTDALTGLPNRVAMVKELSRMLDDMKARDSTLGVVAVDLDQFKRINDDFGHAAGDAVLLAIADRLRKLLGTNALLVRPGGDEFMAFIPWINAERVAEIANDIITALAEPVVIAGGARVFATASVGYLLAPRDGTRDDDLVRRVELALTKAKSEGGGIAIDFAPEMDLELSRRRALESALRAAITQGAIGVAYQPVVDPTGKRVLGVEALARWTDPMLGPIPPDVFVPLAEELGLIGQMGDIVMRRAMTDALAWPSIMLAVNVSGAQIHHGDVVAVVRDMLAQSQFPPERLEIEVTEGVLLSDERRADEQIKGLQALKAKVALDDFGSGYSSVMYLRKFGFDKLKIDRGFVDEIGRSHDNTVILASIIRLGLDLGMVITAEGIETEQQRAWLEASGCHQLQGYLFSRPLAAAELGKFLATHRPSLTVVSKSKSASRGPIREI
jgi:diguanylate cyclase (GGDEF)-like protein